MGHDRDEPAWNRCSIKPVYADLTGAAQIDVQQKQGHAPFGVEMKITDDGGNRLPWDGKTFGRLKIRGPAVARAYFKENIEVLDDEGYFDTGDVSTIDPYGYMEITDRAKDVIKSGGEWISSIEIETLAVGHPKIAEAAVIGLRHPKWEVSRALTLSSGRNSQASRQYDDGQSSDIFSYGFATLERF